MRQASRVSAGHSSARRRRSLWSGLSILVKPGGDLLAEGEYTMTVKLSPDQWTNVNGKKSAGGFVETLKKIENIGLTFGGGCFFWPRRQRVRWHRPLYLDPL